MGYRKSDVEMHNDGYGRPAKPAVNVKVYASIRDVKLPFCTGLMLRADGHRCGRDIQPMVNYDPKPCDRAGCFERVMTNPHFTQQWIEERVPDHELDEAFEIACEDGWEDLRWIAEEIFGPGAQVFSEGRSGGWAVVDFSKVGSSWSDFDQWDAPMLAKWRSFEKRAKIVAAAVPENAVGRLYEEHFGNWVRA